jgi:ketosteroid isomerase-like protein
MTTDITAGANAGPVRSAGNQEQNLIIVRTIYDAVGRGDVVAILDRVTDDVDWSAEAAGHAAPWHGPRTGKTGVASFFSDLATSIEITEFTPHSFAAGDNNVHLLVRWTFRSTATGRQASMTMHHYWRLRDGKVEYFRGNEDTGQTARVFAT